MRFSASPVWQIGGQLQSGSELIMFLCLFRMIVRNGFQSFSFAACRTVLHTTVGTCCRGGFRRAFLSEGHGTAMRESAVGVPPNPALQYVLCWQLAFLFHFFGNVGFCPFSILSVGNFGGIGFCGSLGVSFGFSFLLIVFLFKCYYY